MAENTLKPFYIEPFTVRLTKQDIEFVRDNFDELFDGDDSIRARQAWNLLCEKALQKITKNNQSQPEDLMQIRELEESLEKHQTSLSQLSDELKLVNEAKIELETKYNELLQQLEALQKNPQVKEIEKPIPISIDEATQVLLNMTPEERFILAQIEHVHKTDAYNILIKRFFNVYQERGNGDYEILRISPSKLKEIKAAFKAQQSQTQS